MSLVLVVVLFFQVEEQWFPVVAGGIAQEEHTHLLSDYVPVDWAASVVCRPEASVAPGLFLVKASYPSEGSASVIRSWRSWV